MALAWSAVVHPVATAPPVHSEREIPKGDYDHDHVRHDLIYELQASHALPRIDCSTTVKTLVLRNPRHLQAFNRFSHRSKRAFSLAIVLGCITSSVFTIVSLEPARVLAVVSFALLVAPLLLSFMVMRVAIIALLVTTYEFWYITLHSAVSSALLCVYFGDAARALLPIVTLVWYVSAFLVDANCSDARAMTVTLLFGAGSVAVFMATVAFQVMPTTRSIVLFTVNGHRLESEDVVLNGLGIVLLLLSRNAFRKYTTAPPTTRGRLSTGSSATSSRVRLIGYRTRIQFVECVPAPTTRDDTPAASAEALVRPPTTTHSSGTPATVPRLSQLSFAAPATTFAARQVLWPALFDMLLTMHGKNVPTWLLARTALVLSVAAAMRPDVPQLAFAAMAASVSYTALSLALSNRAMLSLLLQSFDVQFMLVQHALAHLTAAFLLNWDARNWLTLTSWLWFSWIVTIDALTPIAKRKLTVSKPFLVAVVLVLMVEQAASGVASVYLPTVENRTLFTLRVSRQHGLVVKAIPFFLTRLLSIFWWTWRLLWRVCTQHTNELIVIQGGVEFDDYELHRKLTKRASKRLLRRVSTARQVTAWGVRPHDTMAR